MTQHSENPFLPPWRTAGAPSTSLPSPADALRRVRARTDAGRFLRYRTDPIGYMRDTLGIHPWAGRNRKGQRELIQDIAESVRRQLDGEENVPKIFRVEAGHGVGKTFIAAAVGNWFFDAFAPSITITTAPTKDQVELLLWKDIKSQRQGRNLPGRVLPGTPRMEKAPNHWAIGRTTSDNGGQGTARAQGQHAEYMLFICDEAEGVPKFQFDAINAMMTGGKVMIWLLIANPQTQASEFYKLGKRPGVMNYRLSLLDFPNVLDGTDTVPGGTSREWVDGMIDTHCEAAPAHNEDEYTFEVPWRPGVIYRPDPEFQFRVMGVPPRNVALQSFTTPGAYEAALDREQPVNPNHPLQIGVDVARFGADYGKVYTYARGALRLSASLSKLDTFAYRDAILTAAQTHPGPVSIRVDGTGGFGAGIIDLLRADETLQARGAVIHEVQFGSSAADSTKYANLITNLYAEAAETLKGSRLIRQGLPSELEDDLVDRRFEYVNRQGHILKKLEEKDQFKKRHSGRSPDDGDGAVLALAPERLFKRPTNAEAIQALDELNDIWE